MNVDIRSRACVSRRYERASPVGPNKETAAKGPRQRVFWPFCLVTIFCLCIAAAPPAAAEAGARLGTRAPGNVVLASPVTPNAFGTVGQSVETLLAWELTPPNNSVTWSESNVDAGVYRFQTSPTPVNWWGRVMLPSGSIVDGVELDACDFSGTGQILFSMAADGVGAGAANNVTPVGSTGMAGVPGCSLFSISPFAQLVINNGANNYLVAVTWDGDFSENNGVAAVRVRYHRQVSPAPAVATFPNDVPTTHPFFRFVEALAAAGITAGQAPGTYGVDSPITRGQMAVFLSSALGLHFPD